MAATLPEPPSTDCRQAWRLVARLRARRTRTSLRGFAFMLIHTGKVRVVLPGAETRSGDVRTICADTRGSLNHVMSIAFDRSADVSEAWSLKNLKTTESR